MRNTAIELVELLTQRGLTVTTAESCTGGLVSAAITAVPGASSVLDGAIVTYATSVKGRFLNIDPAILYEIGVVSAECAQAMAKGATELFAADCAIALTGYAGPGGGDEENPTGTVFIAVNVLGNITVLKYFHNGNRDEVREGAATAALRLICDRIKEIVG